MMGWVACSTTRRLPEDDQLYIGIDKITYEDTPAIREKNMKKDTVGVIASIGSAVKEVDRILEGKGNVEDSVASVSGKPYALLDKEEKKRVDELFEREKKDFDRVREEVEAVLAYPPNNSLFGSSSLRSPLQFGLWTYNSLANKKLSLIHI